MLKIRMQRTGRINDPSFRIVVVEHTTPSKAGKYIDKVGAYNPKTKTRTLDEARIQHWISVGAQPSDTVHNMLVSAGIVKGKKINVLPAYKAPEKPAEEAAPAAPVEVPAAEPEAAAEAPAADNVSETAETPAA